MKRLAILSMLLACGLAQAQRNPPVTPPTLNLLPACASTDPSGTSCPGEYYFCKTSTDILWYCRVSTGAWASIDAKAGSGSALPSECERGELFVLTTEDTGEMFHYCETTDSWVQVSGGGGTSTISGATDTSITSPADASLFIYDTATAKWRNKVMSGDATITDEGAVTIAADAVALTTDTTGTYVSGATTDGGLLLTGTEGATVGLREDCGAAGTPLEWDGDSWECGTDDGASGTGDVDSVGDTGGEGCLSGACFSEAGTGNALFFEGTASNTEEIKLVGANPGSDFTVTIPAETGTICTTGSVCTGYEGVLTNEAGLETAVGGDNVIVDTEIDTQAELNAIVGDATLPDATGTETISAQWTFTANPRVSVATPNIQIYDADTAGTGAVLGVQCTDAGGGSEDCDFTISQANGGSLVERMAMDADGAVTFNAFEDNVIQFKVRGASTQTADIFVVEQGDASPDGTDILTVDTNGLTVATVSGSSKVEFVDNASACPDPASGSTSVCTVGGKMAVKDTSTASRMIADEELASVSIDPGAHYDADTASVNMFTVDASKWPNGISVLEWRISCNTASPSPEMNVNLRYADAWTTLATPVLMDTLDTTSGVNSETTPASMDASTVPVGKVIYLQFDTDPEGTCTQMTFEMQFFGPTT